MKQMMKSGRSSLMALVVLVALFVLAGCQPAKQENAAAPAQKDLILATTTSTQDSGLLDVLIPAFEKQSGYQVKTIAVGSGQAMTLGERGEADVLLTHAPQAEKALVEKGVVSSRQLVMHNDFILVGPAQDPARINGKKAVIALQAIAAQPAVFVSRGDRSGTHMLEQALWKKAEIQPSGKSWYQEAGTGMGQTLQIASEKGGYTITDRATYLAQKERLQLTILVQGEAALLNIYHVMPVAPRNGMKLNESGAKAFADFVVSPAGQKLIADFGKDKFGQALFTADAGRNEAELGR